MRFAGSIAILVLIMALAFYSYFGHAGFAALGKLDIEALFDAVGVKLDESLQADIAAYRAIYAGQGFMALYRKCYTIAFDSQRFDFDHQFAAVSSLLVISCYELDSETSRASAMRLFITFCRLSLVEKISALQLNQISEDYGFFSGNPEIIKLWDEYLEHVWVKEVRPHIRRYGITDEYDKKFIELREHFAAEASALINRFGRRQD
ncbi:MAG: hypothetical protein KKB51_20010 [Candidatus Riflebacteria bacterium]|nr:hypothetical protein [Candidatus Riflebacteria bacterium]